MYEIVAKIQSEAFYDGYPLALGFAGGPSLNVFSVQQQNAKELRERAVEWP